MYTGEEGSCESSEMSRARCVGRGADVEGFVNSRDITIANKKSSVQNTSRHFHLSPFQKARLGKCSCYPFSRGRG